MSLRLALVIERFDPNGGGAERSSFQTAQELLSRGHDVTILAGGGADDCGLEKARYLQSPHGRPSNARRLKRFAGWVREQFDVGDFDASLSITMAAPASVVQPRGGLIRETLDRNIALRESAISRGFKRALLATSLKQQTLLALERQTVQDPAVKRFACLSRYVADQFRRHYNVADDRMTLIANAAVMPRISDEQRSAARESIRSGLGIAPDATVFLFAALNPRLKGAHTLLRAMEQLKARGLNAVALMVGCVDYTWQQQAAELGVRDRVKLLPLTRDMPGMYAAADVTVLPTFYDPSSKVVIESLMLGVPAISTAYNGASDFIVADDGAVRGRVIADPADADALATAMADLCDPELRQQCRAQTRGIEAHLTMKRHVDELEQVLMDVAAMRGDG